MRTLYSPLRYPGGKAKVLDFMKKLLAQNPFIKKPAYVEPYAGGAAVALGLLLDGCVSKIYINDYDLAIYSFWEHCIKNHSKKLIEKIRNINISMAEWHKQAAIYNTPTRQENGDFNLGFAAFFLNRCNHSGIIKGGVIGGHEQSGKYKMDCRFNKDDLISRINGIAKHKEQIHIYKEDTKVFLKRKDIKKVLKNSLLYLDPPYYKKGSQLYKNFYKPKDHETIAGIMRGLDGKWVVSYDNHPDIQELYNDFEKREFNLTYFASCSTGSRKKEGKEVMFFSPDIKVIPNVAPILAPAG
ncbi:DNA-methyltransferase [Fibrobacteres bacterium R8-0-B4]